MYLLFTGISFLHPIGAALAAVSILLFVVHLESKHKALTSTVLTIIILGLAGYGMLISQPIAQILALIASSLTAFYILHGGSASRKHSMVIGNLLFMTGIIAYVPPLIDLESYPIQLSVAVLSSVSLILSLYLGKYLK